MDEEGRVNLPVIKRASPYDIQPLGFYIRLKSLMAELVSAAPLKAGATCLPAVSEKPGFTQGLRVPPHRLCSQD